MAQIIKRPFKTFNGVDWDTHFFETSEDMITLSTPATMQLGVNAPFYGAIRYGKIFNVVTVTIACTSNNVGAKVLLGNLPAGFRPTAQVIVPLFCLRSDGTWGYNRCGIQVGTDGNVYFLTEGDSTKEIYCSFSFNV